MQAFYRDGSVVTVEGIDPRLVFGPAHYSFQCADGTVIYVDQARSVVQPNALAKRQVHILDRFDLSPQEADTVRRSHTVFVVPQGGRPTVCKPMATAVAVAVMTAAFFLA